MRFIRGLSVFASAGIAVLVWEGAAAVLDSPLLPAPHNVAPVLLKVLFQPDTFENLGASVLLVLSGFLLSLAVALPTALLCFRSRHAAQVVLPFHEFIRYIPVPAFVPLCAAVLGVGDLTKVSLIFIGTYFQVVFMFIADFLATPREIEETARTLGVRRTKLLLRVHLPAALPRLLDTVRITFAWSWSYLLVAEVVNSTRGIGYLVLQSYRVLNMSRLMALLVIIGVFGLLADRLLKKLRNRFCPWVGVDADATSS